MLKQKRSKKALLRLKSKKVPRQLKLYQFPIVPGLDDVSLKLNSHPAENVFNALLHGFELRPISDEKSALEGERMLEYLGRAFEHGMPTQIEYYHHILVMLLEEFDSRSHIRASKGMLPHEFLNALLKEDKVSQKSLVPDCFYTESQVSEFLHQKKGRSKLNYEQAVVLGKKFKVDPLNFL